MRKKMCRACEGKNNDTKIKLGRIEQRERLKLPEPKTL